MMLVLADDLTGAAEAGGIALRFGLSAEVQTGNCYASNADIVIADTDSRESPATEAARRTRRRYEQCCGLSGRRLFKKVDSVLRGNVIAETVALLEATNRNRALLVPANPELGRIVREGQYWIDDVPLDRTDFANDPEWPAMTADVVHLLGYRATGDPSERWPVVVASLDEDLPASGIVVGEVCTSADLYAWANRVDSSTIPAGSAAFLDAYLLACGEKRGSRAPIPCTPVTASNRLFVCGSTSESSHQFCQAIELKGTPVIRIPEELFDDSGRESDLIDVWVAATVDALGSHTCVVLAIDRPVRHDPGLSHLITEYLSTALENVLDTCPVGHLLVEGGATAEALVQRMGWRQLTMVAEIAPGVVSTQVVHEPNLLLTMKPGSYHWPSEILM